MKRLAVALGVALAVGAVPAAPATAQTRVAVMLGFALPRPYVSGVIVVGPRYEYDAEPEVVVVPATLPVSPSVRRGAARIPVLSSSPPSRGRR
jgi:hypothetical protein